MGSPRSRKQVVRLCPPSGKHGDRFVVFLVVILALEGGQGALVIPIRVVRALAKKLEALTSHLCPRLCALVDALNGPPQGCIAHEAVGELRGENVLILKTRGHAPVVIVFEELFGCGVRVPLWGVGCPMGDVVVGHVSGLVSMFRQ